jgi:hypothetical protein
VGRVERLLEQLGPVDGLQQLVHPVHLVRARDVEPEREAAEAVGSPAEMRLVVRGGVERYDDPVRPLEEAMRGLALGILGPAEGTHEFGHALHVGAGEREEIELRGRDR